VDEEEEEAAPEAKVVEEPKLHGYR